LIAIIRTFICLIIWSIRRKKRRRNERVRFYNNIFRIDILKIDQPFIRNIENNKEVVTAISFLAKNLNLKIIAEGVETENQIEVLREIGCEDVQGYYYSPPVPIEEFEANHCKIKLPL